VARLGEFSPNGKPFTVASLLKIAESAHILILLFHKHASCINFDKKWIGLHFGRFFHKLGLGQKIPKVRMCINISKAAVNNVWLSITGSGHGSPK
jgi:hypothetical protein